MKCKLCQSEFYIRHHLLSLFNHTIDYICDTCYMRVGINIEVETIVFDEYEVKVITLFKESRHINYHYYYKEYSKIIEAYVHSEEYQLIFLDSINVTKNLELLYFISKLNEKNLIILTFTSS